MVKFIEDKASGVIQKLTGALPLQTAGLAPSGSYDVWNGSNTPAPTTLVIAGAVNVVAPSASGELVLGSNASGSNGTWAGAVSYNYKWSRDNVDIPGATAQNYAFQPADQGLRIEFAVQAVDSFGTPSPWVKSPNYFDFPAAGGYYLASTDFTVTEQSGANTRKVTVTITKDLPSDLVQYQVYTGTNTAGVLSAATLAPATGTRPGPFVFTGSTQWAASTALSARIALTDAGDDTNPVWVSATSPFAISGLPPALTGVEILTGTVTAGDITIKIPSVTQDPVRANTSYEYRINGGTPVTLTGGTTINVLQTIGGLGAVAVNVEVRAVNLNGNGPWTAPVSVSPFSALATTNLTSVTIAGETYGISASSTPGTAVPAGYDQEGNVFVVGSFWIVSASTAPSVDGTRAVHGIVKNPDAAGNQGWDALMGGTYSGGLLSAPPLQLVAGDVAVQVISRLGLGNTRLNTSDHRDGVINKVTCLYSLSAAPAANRLTPAIVAATPATRPQASINPAAILAAMPTPRSMTGIPVAAWADVAMCLDRFDPMFGKISGGDATTGYERSLTYLIGGRFGNYGENFATTLNMLLVGIRGNTWSDADKRTAIMRLASFGHQWFWGLKARADFLPPDGGHYQFYWAAIIAYLNWSGQTSELSSFESTMLGHIPQANRMTAEDFGEYRTPHSSETKMAASRIRPINLINSQTSFSLRFDANNGDTSRQFLDGVLLVRVATGEKRTITQVNSNFVSGLQYIATTITAPYSTNITLSDTFYMEAAFAVNHGDLLWANNTSLTKWYGAHRNSYASNNTGWTGQLQFLAELGILPSFAYNAARLATISNLTNFPAGYDFPRMTAAWARISDGTQYDADTAYYTTYGATDFAPYTAPKTSVPAIYGQTATSLSGTQISGAVSTTDAQGGFFWVAVPSGSAAPSAQQIYNRKKADNTAAPVFGEKNVFGVGATSWTLEGFTAATAYNIYFVQQDYSGNFSNVVSASVTTGASGTTYRETFLNRVAGDVWATDPPGATLPFSSIYTRSSTNLVPTVITDTDAPDDLAVQLATSTAYHTMVLNDLTTRLALPWSRLQARGRFKMATVQSRFGMGHRLGTNLHNGVRTNRATANTNTVGLQLSGNLDSGTNLTAMPTAVFADGAIIEVLLEIGNPDKKTMRAKAWKVGPTGGISEPAWGATATANNSEVSVTDAADIVFTTLGFAGHRGTMVFHGLIVTVDGDAPVF